MNALELMLFQNRPNALNLPAAAPSANSLNQRLLDEGTIIQGHWLDFYPTLQALYQGGREALGIAPSERLMGRLNALRSPVLRPQAGETRSLMGLSVPAWADEAAGIASEGLQTALSAADLAGLAGVASPMLKSGLKNMGEYAMKKNQDMSGAIGKNISNNEYWRDTSKWDIPEFEDIRVSDNHFENLLKGGKSKSYQEREFTKNRIDKYEPPIKEKFLTTKNVDEISSAIMAVKEGKLSIDDLGIVVTKNLPLSDDRGMGFIGEYYNGTIEQNIPAYLAEYLKDDFEVPPWLGSSYFKNDVGLFDKVVNNFRKNPAKLLNDIKKSIGFFKSEDEANDDLIKTMLKLHEEEKYKKTPEYKRSLIKLADGNVKNKE